MKEKNKPFLKYAISDYLDISGLLLFLNPDFISTVPVIVGIDPSFGITEGSYTAIQGISLIDARQVFEYNGKANKEEIIIILKKIIEHGFDIRYIVVERNSIGSLLLRDIQKELPYIKLYAQKTSTGSTTYGFFVSKNSKELLFNYLSRTISENPGVVYSRRLYAELKGLTIKQGRIDTKFRMDLVISFGLAIIGRYDYIQNYATSEELESILIPKELTNYSLSEINIQPKRVSLYDMLVKTRPDLTLLTKEEIEKIHMKEVLGIVD